MVLGLFRYRMAAHGNAIRSGRSARRRYARDQGRLLSLPSLLLLPLSLLRPQLQRAGQRHGQYRLSRGEGLRLIAGDTSPPTLILPSINHLPRLASAKFRARCYARTKCARIPFQISPKIRPGWRIFTHPCGNLSTFRRNISYLQSVTKNAPANTKIPLMRNPKVMRNPKAPPPPKMASLHIGGVSPIRRRPLPLSPNPINLLAKPVAHALQRAACTLVCTRHVSLLLSAISASELRTPQNG